MIVLSRLFLTLVAILTVVAVSGCEEPYVEPGVPASTRTFEDPKEEVEEPPQKPGSTTVIQGGGSALGGSKRVTQDVIGDVQERTAQPLDEDEE